jgi:hypothetical protein
MSGTHRALLIAGVLAASCARTASAQAHDPCALLTPAQIQVVLGAKVGSGQPIGSTGCSWSAAAAANTHAAMVTLSLVDASGFTTMKTPLPGVAKNGASGIGDDAFYTTVSTLTTLSVKEGNVAFVVRLYGVPGQSKQEAVEKSLALDVLKKV